MILKINHTYLEQNHKCLEIKSNESQSLRSKSQVLRRESQALRTNSLLVRNELKELRAASRDIKNKSYIVRTETQMLRNKSAKNETGKELKVIREESLKIINTFNVRAKQDKLIDQLKENEYESKYKSDFLNKMSDNNILSSKICYKIEKYFNIWESPLKNLFVNNLFVGNFILQNQIMI